MAFQLPRNPLLHCLITLLPLLNFRLVAVNLAQVFLFHAIELLSRSRPRHILRTASLFVLQVIFVLWYRQLPVCLWRRIWLETSEIDQVVLRLKFTTSVLAQDLRSSESV